MAKKTERELAIIKARRLRALALDQEGLPEGAVASAAFDRLVGKWSLKAREIEEQTVLAESVERGPMAETWRAFLLSVIADAFDCSAAHNMETGTSRLYGDRLGIDKTMAAYRWVSGRLIASSNRYMVWEGEFWGISQNDYCMSFILSLARRIHTEKRRAEAPPEAEAPAAVDAALVASRTDLQEAAKEKASQNPEMKTPTFQYVPAAELAASMLTWPPPEEQIKPAEPLLAEKPAAEKPAAEKPAAENA